MDRYGYGFRRWTSGCEVGWFCLAIVCLLATAVPCPAAEPPACERGVLITLNGPITLQLAQSIYRRLDDAEHQEADLVVIQIDSPGGYLQESLDIAERLRLIDWAHTVAFVAQDGEAISGAAIAALGCDEIIMHPEASIGDAGPIYQGEGGLFRHAPEKIRSYLRAEMRKLAKAKNRPPAIAEAMVDMELTVYRVKNRRTGEETFMSDKDIEADANPEDWEKLQRVAESGGKNFLTVSGSRAVEIQLAEGNVASREELRKRYRLKDEFTVLKSTWVDQAVFVLNLPFITGLLFLIGLGALYVEFSAPGIGIGGATACLCFAIFFWSRFMGGTAEWLEPILFLAGIVFLGLELFVIPGFGIAGLTGVLLLLVSVVMASVKNPIPGNSRDVKELATTLAVVMTSGGLSVTMAWLLGARMSTFPMLSRLLLPPPPDTSSGTTDSVSNGDQEDSVFRPELGDVGIAHSALRPAGRVKFGDQYVDVVTEGAFANRGDRVKVIQIHGNRIVVDLAGD